MKVYNRRFHKYSNGEGLCQSTIFDANIKSGLDTWLKTDLSGSVGLLTEYHSNLLEKILETNKVCALCKTTEWEF